MIQFGLDSLTASRATALGALMRHLRILPKFAGRAAHNSALTSPLLALALVACGSDDDDVARPAVDDTGATVGTLTDSESEQAMAESRDPSDPLGAIIDREAAVEDDMSPEDEAVVARMREVAEGDTPAAPRRSVDDIIAARERGSDGLTPPYASAEMASMDDDGGSNLWLYLGGLGLAAVAAGGGGSSGAAAVNVAGQVFDGPIQGARVYIDVDGNGSFGSGDVEIATTDENGFYSGSVPGQHRDKFIRVDLTGAFDTDPDNDPSTGSKAALDSLVSYRSAAPVEAFVSGSSATMTLSPLSEMVAKEFDTSAGDVKAAAEAAARTVATDIGLADTVGSSGADILANLGQYGVGSDSGKGVVAVTGAALTAIEAAAPTLHTVLRAEAELANTSGATALTKTQVFELAKSIIDPSSVTGTDIKLQLQDNAGAGTLRLDFEEGTPSDLKIGQLEIKFASNTSLTSTQGANIKLVTATGADVAADYPFTLTRVSQASDIWEIDVSGTFDFEATSQQKSWTLYVSRELDSEGGNSVAFPVTVYLADKPEAPVFSAATRNVTVREDATDIATISATGDIDAVIRYSITSGNTGGLFSIDASSGQITARGLDHDTAPTTYALTVTATATGFDGVDRSSTQTVNVALSDVNDEAPVFTGALAPASVNLTSRTAVGSVVADLTATTDTAGANLVFTVNDDRFEVNASNQLIVAAGQTGLTLGDTYNVVVTATATDGSDVTTATKAISILGQNGQNAVFAMSKIPTVFSPEFASENTMMVELIANDPQGNGPFSVTWQYLAVPANDGTGAIWLDNVLGNSFGLLPLNARTGTVVSGGETWSRGAMQGGIRLDNGVATGWLYAIPMVISGSGTIRAKIEYTDGDGNQTTVYSGHYGLAGSAPSAPFVASAEKDYFDGGLSAPDVTTGARYATGIVSYGEATAAINVNFATNSYSGWATGDVFTNVGEVRGTDYNDTLTANASGMTLAGGAGDDTLTGGAGGDVLHGEAGNDTLTGNGGADVLYGGTGNDRLDGGAGNDKLYGGQGDDILRAGAGNDTLSGGAGNDMLYGGAGNDKFDGGAGHDTVDFSAEAGNNAVVVDLTILTEISFAIPVGIVGNNFVRYGSGWTVRSEGGHTIELTIPEQAIGNEVTIGGAVSDALIINIESLVGGGGNDRFTGGAESNRFVGNGGNDILDGGGFGNDTLDGGAGNDILRGGAGNDTLIGGAGNDTITAGWGNDKIDGGAGSDTLIYTGQAGAVIADLGRAAETEGAYSGYLKVRVAGRSEDYIKGIENITGGALGDYFVGDAEVNVLDGAGGIDTISYAHSTAGVTVDLRSAQSASGGHAQGDTIANFENVVGGAGADTLYGLASARSKIEGGAGNDTITTGSGDDVIWGGAGNDTIVAGSGNDRVVGGAGADNMDGGAGTDDVLFYSDAETGVTLDLTTASNNTGDAAGDTITGFERFVGSYYNDIMRGTSGGDTLYGDYGDDILQGRAGNDTLEGGYGTDVADYNEVTTAITVNFRTLTEDANGYITLSLNGTDKLSSIEGIIGGSAGDTLTGGDSAADMFEFVDGKLDDDDLHDLSGGDKKLLLAKANTLESIASANLTLAPGDVTAIASRKTAANADNATDAQINNYVTTVRAAIQFVLTSSTDVAVLDKMAQLYHYSFDDYIFDGGGGNDTLTGSGGDDILKGGAGVDTIDGGVGYDIIDFSNETQSVVISLISTANASGFRTATVGGTNADTFKSIEGVIGGAGDDTITGDNTNALVTNLLKGGAGNDTITGGIGDDVIYGGAGGDTINAGSGDDWIDGGDGNDTIDGGLGYDTLSFETASAAVIFDRTTTSANTQTDTLTGIEYLSGSAYGDTLGGLNNVDDVIWGRGGDDTLRGYSGNDTLRGEDGDDVLEGGAGGDTLYGGRGSNQLFGGAGNDTLYDTLFNDTGADVYNGGAGIDTVYYSDIALAGELPYPFPIYEVPIVAILDATGRAANTGHAAGDSYSGVENIVGTRGHDTLGGDIGANRIDGGYGFDTVTYRYSNAAVTVNLFDSAVESGGHAAGDTLVNIMSVIGSNFADTITADNQTYTAAGSVKVIEGGAGGDTLDGNSGSAATLSYASDTVGVTINMGQAAGAGGYIVVSGNAGSHAEGDSFKGFENLTGGSGRDTLSGNSSANTLDGGAEADTLTGAGGGDVFVLNVTDASTDIVTDFTATQSDKVQVKLSGAAHNRFDNIDRGSGNDSQKAAKKLGVAKSDTKIEWTYSGNINTGTTTNDTAVNDTLIYLDANGNNSFDYGEQALMVLEDFNADLVFGYFEFV